METPPREGTVLGPGEAESHNSDRPPSPNRPQTQGVPSAPRQSPVRLRSPSRPARALGSGGPAPVKGGTARLTADPPAARDPEVPLRSGQTQVQHSHHASLHPDPLLLGRRRLPDAAPSAQESRQPGRAHLGTCRPPGLRRFGAASTCCPRAAARPTSWPHWLLAFKSRPTAPH